MVIALGTAPLNGFIGLDLTDFIDFFSVKANAIEYSEDVSNWTFKGNANFDSKNNYFILTPDQTWCNGSMWLNYEIKSNFMISFDYYSGCRIDGGADGLAVVFYNKDNLATGNGGAIMYKGITGYAVELDTYTNSEPTDHNHISINKSQTEHLSWDLLPESEDGLWHTLDVAVVNDVCYVFIDKNLKLCYKTPTTGFGYLGITSATGASKNLHAVKNIQVTTELSSGGVGDIIYKNGMPVLSSKDAQDFLCFLYNKELVNVSSDKQYKLLTGSLSGYSSDEIKNAIAAFGDIVQPLLNSYVDSSKYKSDVWRKALIERLENELPSKMGIIADGIVDNADSFTSGEIFKSLEIVVDSDMLDLAGAAIGGILKAADVAGKVTDFYNYSCAAMESLFFSYEQEMVGRYSYFNSYLNCRDMDEQSFKIAMDTNFLLLSDSTFLSKLLDCFTWLTGKDSWTNHRDDLDRWAEYLWQLCEYQKKDPHNYQKIVYNPTCTTEGYAKHTCQYCNEVYYDDYKDALGHKYNKTTIKPGCETIGYDLYECTKCSYHYTDNEVMATGHINATKTTYEATCNDSGYNLYRCSCGASWKENEISALGHSYVSTVIEPTETERGYTHHKCSLCNKEYYSDYINPTEHIFISTVTEPTCEADGYTTHTCSDCGYEYTDSIIKSSGCLYTVSSQTDATCNKEGSTTYACEVCGKSYTETIPLAEHDYSYSVSVIEATCNEQGYTIHRCECGESITDNYIEAFGHNYLVIEQKELTCSEDGYITYECDNCKDSYTEIEETQGHLFEFVETVEAGCLTSGYTLQVCSICDCEHYSNVIPPKDHTLGEWVALRNEAGNSTGQREAKCLNCDFVYTEECPSYQVMFSVEGVICDSYECAFGDILTTPDNPTKEGYTFAGWTPAIPESMPDMEMTFTAVFEPITYTATFTSGGEIIGTDEFIISDESLDYPVIEEKAGYVWIWDEHEIVADNITVSGDYSIITYTEDFVIDGETVSSQQFTVLEPDLVAPEIPVKEGYSAAWEEYDGILDNLIVNAVYTPITYTATFTSGGEIIGTDEFIISDESLDYPIIEEKTGCEWIWNEHKIVADNITINGEYVLIPYTVTFVADGTTVDIIEFNVKNQTIVSPSVPEKIGYTAVWEKYEVNLADFTVNAVYTPIVYTATFTHNGETIGMDEFTIEDVSLDYPDIVEKEHYEWAWDEHSIEANNLVIDGKYVPITYTIEFVSSGKTIKTQTFNIETANTIIPPSFFLPNKAGYYSEWEEWEGKICNLTVNEIYVPIKYSARFWCNGNLIRTSKFTVENKKTDFTMPYLPKQEGYKVVWEDFEIVPNDIDVYGEYVPIEYTATFIADGVVISTQTFTVETESLDVPLVPQKAGYYARWSSYNIEAKDITIVAKYHLPEVVTVSKRTLDVGDTYRLLPSCNFEITEKAWVSSDTSVATVNQHGKVTAVGKGECEITITCYGKDSLENDIQASKVTKIIVNDNSEASTSKRSFRDLFDEFFEVTLHDLIYNLREFMLVLLRYAY